MTADTLVAVSAALRDLAIAGVVGGLLLIAVALPRDHPAVGRTSLIARVASMVWVVAALTFSLASYANIRGSGTDASRFLQEWWQYSTSVDLLKAYLQMVLAAVVVSIMVAFVRRPMLAIWTFVPVAWGLGWQAETGHAAGATDHHLGVSAMALHIAGSAIWMGLIGVVAALRGPLGDDAKRVVRRMSRAAIWGAILLIVSGAVNAWMRLESPADFVTTTYGRLILAKILLMSLAIGLAAWHRRTYLPLLSSAQVRQRFWRVLSVDVVALVTVIGIAAVLSTQAPPIPIVPVAKPSPAYYLTGYELPPAPSFANWLLLWRLEIFSLFVIASLAIVYMRWVWRLNRRGDRWPVYRTILWLVGMALLVWITQGGPAIYGAVTFSGHMVEHMLLITVVPLPLTLGAPITLALRALPVRKDGSRGPREWLRGIVESRFMQLVSNPIVAAVIFAGSLIIFYYSPIFEFALRNHAGHLWMLAHFSIAGYLFFNALIGIDPGPNRFGYPLRIVLLFATMASHAFFGVALTMSHELLAPTWFGLMGRPWGPDAITDQQYGGQLAWGMGELPVLALAIGVIALWRQSDDRESSAQRPQGGTRSRRRPQRVQRDACPGRQRRRAETVLGVPRWRPRTGRRSREIQRTVHRFHPQACVRLRHQA